MENPPITSPYTPMMITTILYTIRKTATGLPDGV